MINRQLVRWTMVLSSLALVGCGQTEGETSAPSTGQLEQEVPEETVVLIEDAAGNSVEVPKNPQRVAVFDNGQLDNMASIGMEDRVVLTASPNLPEHLSNYEDIEAAGSFFEIDLEVTNAAEPDLIIVAGRSSSAYDDLSDIAPTIDLSNDSTQYIDSISANLNRLAAIFETEEEVDSLISELESELDELNRRAEESDMTTLMAMYNEGSLSAYGPGSRFGVVHDAFGFMPVDNEIEESNHGMEISYEYVLSMDPDILFLIDRTAAIGGDTSAAPVEENPIIQETQAYQTDSIHYLSPSAWYLAEGGVGTFRIMMQEVSEAIE